MPYPQCHYNLYKNFLLFLEICLFLLIEWMFGDIVFFVFFILISLLMLCYAFNLLMAFDCLLLKGLLTYLRYRYFVDILYCSAFWPTHKFHYSPQSCQ